MAVLRRIGKLSPITPEEVQSQTGYTIYSHNRSRRPKSALPNKEGGETLTRKSPNK